MNYRNETQGHYCNLNYPSNHDYNDNDYNCLFYFYLFRLKYLNKNANKRI